MRINPDHPVELIAIFSHSAVDASALNTVRVIKQCNTIISRSHVGDYRPAAIATPPVCDHDHVRSRIAKQRFKQPRQMRRFVEARYDDKRPHLSNHSPEPRGQSVAIGIPHHDRLGRDSSHLCLQIIKAKGIQTAKNGLEF